ncbi:hypothetical protein NQ318_020896 [Aromia moschata]|uniref:Uncharacterized protein n=1 Tax=Aromia moschata TaxID=1265417 RepID=A0AAV8XY39_9CUCU|nr:hypothetical protein NQ318_020896 [Aromia moschata]
MKIPANARVSVNASKSPQTFKGLYKYGTCFALQSSRPPPRWPSHGHLEYGIPIRGRLEDGRYPRLLF